MTAWAKRISEAWAQPVDGPPELHGAMMAVRLPGRWQKADPARLMRDLLARRRTVVAINSLGGTLWARMSAQVYHAAADCDPLLDPGG